MGLNDGILETFIFNVRYSGYAYVTVKVVINFTKGMYTVYDSRGRILVRKEKVSIKELLELKKKIINDMTEELNPNKLFGGFMI